MKTINFILVSCLLFCLISCKEDNIVNPKIQTNEWYEIKDTIRIKIPMCLYYPSTPWINDSTERRYDEPNDSTYNPEYVVNDSSTYYVELQNLKYGNCNLPIINFNTFTLIGKFKHAGGSPEPEVKVSIFRNDSLKKIAYYITVKRMNMNDIPNSEMIWYLIPKVSSDYTYEFHNYLKYNY